MAMPALYHTGLVSVLIPQPTDICYCHSSSPTQILRDISLWWATEQVAESVTDWHFWVWQQPVVLETFNYDQHHDHDQSIGITHDQYDHDPRVGPNRRAFCHLPMWFSKVTRLNISQGPGVVCNAVWSNSWLSFYLSQIVPSSNTEPLEHSGCSPWNVVGG